ncbi:Hypothetical predicted protein [Pelobates cultripes]|uniref:Uncharacterized protein n=1 Tax=Pelobates cultripes TaxID=61616 RepID=A0AAD1RGG5_PELCU|nr:Hypothetical predicted protein [Pelobates cultripes]
MAHIWWTCPRLQQYWKDITKLITDSTGCTLPHNLEHYMLFDIPESLPKPDRYLIFHINIAALGALAQNWLSQTIPSISMCIQQISQSGHFETTMRRQNTPPNKPHKKYRRYWEIAWDKWETYKGGTTGNHLPRADLMTELGPHKVRTPMKEYFIIQEC